MNGLCETFEKVPWLMRPVRDEPGRLVLMCRNCGETRAAELGAVDEWMFEHKSNEAIAKGKMGRDWVRRQKEKKL